jgi:hypothetical protein
MAGAESEYRRRAQCQDIAAGHWSDPACSVVAFAVGHFTSQPAQRQCFGESGQVVWTVPRVLAEVVLSVAMPIREFTA